MFEHIRKQREVAKELEEYRIVNTERVNENRKLRGLEPEPPEFEKLSDMDIWEVYNERERLLVENFRLLLKNIRLKESLGGGE